MSMSRCSSTVFTVYGPRRVRRRRQHVRRSPQALDDVRCVPAAGAFRVIGVDRAPFERRDCRLDEARLVERVRVNRDLHVVALGHVQAIVDRRRRRAPVLVQLQPHGAGFDLLVERFGQARVALAEKSEVHRERVGRLEHARDVPRPRSARRCVRAGRRARAAADHRRYAVHQRLFDLLRPMK